MNKRLSLKSAALGLAFIIIAVGIIFIFLDILDIAEDYRLYWPIAILNTIFISTVAVFTIVFATTIYLKSGLPETLALGGGALAFGFSIVLYGWLTDTGLNTRITAYDSGVLVASIVYLAGSILSEIGHNDNGFKVTSRKTSIIVLYIVVPLIISFITWLAYQDIITFLLRQFTEYITARDIIQGVAAVFCICSALIYLRKYIRSRIDVHFWYFLGLILFIAGVLFVSRGHLESRIAWLGRFSQYVGGMCFLLAALSKFKQRDVMGTSK